MKNPVFTTVFTLFSFFMYAQEGKVTLEQDARLEQLLEVYNKVNEKKGYYQIQVGFGTYRKAQDLKARINIDFPGWYSKIEFLEPTYRVRLGRFSSKIEAERRFIEVRKKYPNAMLLKP
ncbi:MAG: SPOR domain-containing protein [Bacteroidota bacterium]